ncbi:MAG: DUF4430 domain-containing protein [Burkholderiales bacterium]|nr:DUF4430 domain-containing protein [Burkholderiales bacterium]
MKKTKIIKFTIIIAFSTILFSLLFSVLFSSFKNENRIKSEIQNTKPQSKNYKIENDELKKLIKITVEINDKKYESTLPENSNIYEHMEQLQKEGKVTFKYKNYPGMGKFIEEINNIKNGEKSWIYYVNNKKATIGISNYKIENGDVVSWKLESNI